VPVKTIFIRLTHVISVHVDHEMASNDFSLSSSSDFKVSEMEDYKLEVEGSPNSSSMASNEEGTQETYANNLLADEEWLEFRFNKIDPLHPSLIPARFMKLN